MMNNVCLTGCLLSKPPILREKTTNALYSDFILVINNDTGDRKLSESEMICVNCRVYGSDTSYLFRNCDQGSMIEISGSVGSKPIRKEGEPVARYINMIVVNYIRVLTRSEIIIEKFDDFIHKYDLSKLKSQLAKKRKEERQAAQEAIDIQTGEEEKEDGETKNI